MKELKRANLEKIIDICCSPNAQLHSAG